MYDELLKAIDLALANDWTGAHEIVQQHESDDTANWIHAVLHKIEGDRPNSRYWYARARQLARVDDEPLGELRAIQSALQAKR